MTEDQKTNKPKYDCITFVDFTEEEFEENKKNAEAGNIPAILLIIGHNQGVLNWKLNKILGNE